MSHKPGHHNPHALSEAAAEAMIMAGRAYESYLALGASNMDDIELLHLLSNAKALGHHTQNRTKTQHSTLVRVDGRI
jgi:hypothetical protein